MSEAGLPTPRQPRSWLYVPAHDARKIAKSRSVGADAVILDLEDAVPDSAKRDARSLVGTELAEGGFGQSQRWVRINSPRDGSGWYDDLAAIAAAPPDGLVIPKVSRPEDITEVHKACDELFGQTTPVRLAPIVTEQAEGVLRMAQTLPASDRTYAAFWGTEDLAASVGASRVRDPAGQLLDVFRVARGLFLLETSRASVPAVDTPYLRIDDLDGVRREAEYACWSGFSGKQVIHPAHVAVVNAAFTPDVAEVDAARVVVAAFERVGGGALRVGDSMVDPPHLRAALQVLARYEAGADR